MIFAHSFVGATSTYAVLKLLKPKLHKRELNVAWVVGIISAVLPDFDISLLVFNRLIEHRRLLTHSIVPYIIITLGIYLLGCVYKNRRSFFRVLSIVFIVGVSTHILMDMFVGGVSIFAPLSTAYYGYDIPFNTKKDFWALDYFSSFYMLAEGLLILPYFYIRKKVKSHIVRTLPWVLFIVALITSTFLMFY